MQLRLLLWDDCNRHCPGCCNKDWDLDALPVCSDFTPFEMIILTGGEPMLYPGQIDQVIDEIVAQTRTPIAIYSAKTDCVEAYLHLVNRHLMGEINLLGFTITLHSQADVKPWQQLAYLLDPAHRHLSLRLNVFKGIDISKADTRGWKVKRDMVWLKNCPLPTNETFMRWRGKL